MRESTKASLGGIISALAIVIMLSTYISPLLVYTAPPFAGILLIIVVNELGYKWSIGTFIAISILSVFVIADKEAAVFFTMFFGYYPILATFLNKSLNNKILKFIVKLLIFDISCFAAVFLCTFVFGISYSDVINEGIIFVAVFILLMNVFFVIYDILIMRLQQLYLLKMRKTIKKLFHIR